MLLTVFIMSKRPSLHLHLLGLLLFLPGGLALAKGKGTPPQKEAAPEPVRVEQPPQEQDPIAADPLEESKDEPTEDALVSEGDESTKGADAPHCGISDRKWSVFLEGGFRWDSGNSARRDQIGEDVNDQNDAVSSLGPMFHLGLMIRQSPHFRMGGALGYGANYDLNNQDLLIGQLVTVDYRLEWSAPLTAKLFILGQPRVAASLVIPGGMLADRISEYQAAGYDTWGGPRYGFLFGLEAGVRYQTNDWLSLRATVGYGWGMHFLLDSKAEGATVSGSHSWQVQASRVSGNLGIEAAF